MDFSAGALFAGSIVSALGVAFFIFGRKQRRAPQFVAGVLLMVGAPFAGGPWMISGAGALILLGLWLALRMGM